MKDFFKGVRKHIGKLDAAHLREQYELVSDELARSETLLHALKEGIILLDGAGAVIRANPAATALFGMTPDDFIPTLTIPLGKSSRREIEITYPETRTLELQTMPLDENTVLIVRDTTAERARAAEEAETGATKSVSDLAAGVAHEIGNPLNALALNQQLIIRNPEKAVEKATQSLAQIKRLDGIIRGFLSALRPQKPNLVPGSVAEPLKNCLAAMRPQFEERRIAVTLDIGTALPPVALDKDQMEQVFFNLVKNALEAMKDGDAISIRIDSDDRDVLVSFKDTGVGMSDEQLAHLFEPYRTTKEKGTGLGLMITARIVRDHGGSISVESEPGRGTEFTVRLPRLERRVRALGQPTEATAP